MQATMGCTAQGNTRTTQSEEGTSHRAASHTSLAWGCGGRPSPLQKMELSWKRITLLTTLEGHEHFSCLFSIIFLLISSFCHLPELFCSLCPTSHIRRITKNHSPCSLKRKGMLWGAQQGRAAAGREEPQLGSRIPCGHGSTSSQGRWALPASPCLSGELCILPWTPGWWSCSTIRSDFRPKLRMLWTTSAGNVSEHQCQGRFMPAEKSVFSPAHFARIKHFLSSDTRHEQGLQGWASNSLQSQPCLQRLQQSHSGCLVF